MSKRLCFPMILLSILLWSAPSRVNSLVADSPQAQNSTAPQLTLKITDWWNAPVTIKKVRIGDQEILPGSSFEHTDDWTKNLSIEGINKSGKTISYIAYAIDFTISGKDSLYRIRLQDGTSYLVPDGLTAPNGLRVLNGHKHKIAFTDDAWSCQSSVADAVNERKAKIVNVELFVETVGFTDDTVWAFGSNLKHNKVAGIYENVEYSRLAKGKNRSDNHARGFVPKETSLNPYFACCVPVFTYMTVQNGGRATQIEMSCSSCPPCCGGGFCPAPVPIKKVNSLSGQGNEAIQHAGTFTQC